MDGKRGHTRKSYIPITLGLRTHKSSLGCLKGMLDICNLKRPSRIIILVLTAHLKSFIRVYCIEVTLIFLVDGCVTVEHYVGEKHGCFR